MPLYDYKCNKCKIVIEFELKMNHRTPKCPKCDNKMIRVYTPIKSIFKGVGFPSNDFKRLKNNGIDY